MKIEELVVRFTRGETTAEEQERLYAWRRSGPRNEAEFQEIVALMELARETERSLETEPASAESVIQRALGLQQKGFDTAAATREVEGKPATAPAPPGAADRGFRGLSRLRMGPAGLWRDVLKAAVLIPIGVGLGILLSETDRGTGFVATTEVATSAGERTTLTLDGVTVRLGPTSRVIVSQGRDRPEVYLEGRAFFAVQPDSSRTFAVSTPNGRAVALGTRFEVRSESAALRVMVVEGQVAMESGSESTRVDAGELVESVDGATPTKSVVDNVFAELGWMGNALVFQGTPLRQALSEIERRFGADVALRDPSLGDLPLTVTFTDQSFRRVVRIICETLKARCDIHETRAVIGVLRRSGA